LGGEGKGRGRGVMKINERSIDRGRRGGFIDS
jgi:hypothetical protein